MTPESQSQQPRLIPRVPWPIPPWVPEAVADRLSGRQVSLTRLPTGVRRRLATPEKIGVTDEVWYCAVEQSGKTSTMLNCLGWAIDCAPGNVFYLMPTEATADKFTGAKLKPMLARTPRLSRYLSGRQDDVTLAMIRLSHGVTIFPAHANSASSMATWPALYSFGDEVDKYPPMAGQEASPIELIKKRNRLYKGRYKRFFASTPAGLFIHAGMERCRQVWEMRLRCPHCGEMIRMDADHLVLPPDAAAHTVTAADVRYACNACGVQWDEMDRERAIDDGRWYCRKGEDVQRPATVGFHHRAWECADITLLEIAQAWLRMRHGGQADKVAWHNGYEAEDTPQERITIVSQDGLLRFRSELPRNLVPDWAAMLWLLADTQQDSFYTQVWACGHAPSHRLHMVRHGQVRAFEDLEGLLAMDFRDLAGRVLRIGSGLIDSGGTRRGWQKHSRTVEVYDWCSRHRVMIPHKGVHGRSGELIGWKTVTVYPGTNKPIPGGLARANLRVDFFKDALAALLALEPDDPVALSFHCDIDQAFARHYTTETRNVAGDWEHDRAAGRNDYWDCTVYALALREVLKLRIGPPPEQEAGPSRPSPAAGQAPDRGARW